jgi:hypothetical protein
MVAEKLQAPPKVAEVPQKLPVMPDLPKPVAPVAPPKAVGDMTKDRGSSAQQ